MSAGHYLKVTFRDGRAFAAYLYLPRKPNTKAARTRDVGRGMFVDFDADGAPIGVEITAPTLVTSADVNAVLTELGLAPVSSEELSPFRAA